MNGIKNIEIHAVSRFPIVSAYEFEHIKKEEEVQEYIKDCTIYFIVQRPLIVIENFTASEGIISFRMNDSTESNPLECSFSPSDAGIGYPGEDLFIEAQFYENPIEPVTQPCNGVAGFKVYSENKEFLCWFNPQRILYHHLVGGPRFEISGPIDKYIDYNVHYVGKSFSQEIWDRLTGHHKLQSVLTVEDQYSDVTKKPSYEVSLLLLDIDGFTEANIFPNFENSISDDVKPIVYDLSGSEEELSLIHI